MQSKSIQNRHYIGKFYIEKHKLKDNLLSVKYSKNEVPPSQLRPRSISADVDVHLNLRTIIEKLVPRNGTLIARRYLIDVNPAVYQRRQGLAEQNLIDA